MVAASLAFDPSHDAWNRLVRVQEGVLTQYVFAYDGLGRRILEGMEGVAQSYKHFFFSAGWQTLETRATSTENAEPETLQPYQQYVWSARYIDSPVLRDKNTDEDGLCDDQRLYYLTDANFNVTTLVDTAGDAVERYLYDPYGKVTIYDGPWTNTRTFSSYQNEILYTGRERHTNSGLYYYRGRWYHPPLGRFISRDPIESDGCPNPYWYVDNAPTNWDDPLGLWRFVPQMGTLSGVLAPGDYTTYGKASSCFDLTFDSDKAAFASGANGTCCAEVRFVQIFYMDSDALINSLPNREWTLDPYRGTPPYYPDGTWKNPATGQSTMHDHPYFNRLWKYSNSISMDFEVCAVCSKSSHKDGVTGIGDVFACMKWGHSFILEGTMLTKKISGWKRYVTGTVWDSDRTQIIRRRSKLGDTFEEIRLGGVGGTATFTFFGIAAEPSNEMKKHLTKYFP